MAQRRPIDVAVLRFYGALFVTTVAVWGLVALWVGLTRDDPSQPRQLPFLNVAFCVTWLIGVFVTVAILEYAKRRPAGQAMSWGEAMLGATISFFLMFWWWGVVPHQWLSFADNELGWRADKILVGPEIGPEGQNLLEWLLPFTITYLVVRDMIVVAIYGVTIAAFVWIWAIWQGRGKVAPQIVPQSSYGRPLVREGV